MLAIVALSLPTISYHSGASHSGSLLSDFGKGTPLRIAFNTTELAALFAAVVVLAVLTPRTGVWLRILGYIAVAIGVGAELYQIASASYNDFLPYSLTLREEWNNARSPGTGTWFYWLFLTALPVLYIVRDTLTRRPGRARRAVPAP